jgi:hypothetical protein
MNIPDTSKAAWETEIVCEGGPLIVANLDDFRAWRGAEPFDPSQATELHHWGQFTADLPAAWRPNGPAGHQYIADADPAQRREDLAELVLARWPCSTVVRGDGQWRITRPDGKFMHLALAPDSEYDRATRGFQHEGLHAFAQGASAYFCDVEPGMVGVRVEAGRTRLVIAQVVFSEDDAGTARAYAHAYARGSGRVMDTGQGLRYRVTQGPVVAAWSPYGAQDLDQPIDALHPAAGAIDRQLDFAIQASGALVRLEPGWYTSSLYYHEHPDEDWGVAWCVLERT